MQLCCDEHEMIEFGILRGGKKRKKKTIGIQTLACSVIALGESKEIAMETNFSQ